MPDQPEARAGRPAGTVQTPKTILKADMAATHRLNKELRELIGQLVKEVKAEMRAGQLAPKDKAELITMLTASLQNNTKSMDSVVKLLLQAGANGDGGIDDDTPTSAEDLLESLTKGKN